MTRHGAFLRVMERVAVEMGGEASRVMLALFVAESGGERLMVPDEHDLFLECRNKNIRDRYRGHNAEELALRYSVSVSQVKRIVAGQ